jgi:hypothetical protein
MPKNTAIPKGSVSPTFAGSLLAVLIAVLAIGVVAHGALRSDSSERPEFSGAPAFDPSRFVLNALLVPALDTDSVPLRWADPRPAMGCGPNSSVLVDGQPMRRGDLVPDVPFELEWQSDGCRPFGTQGPRFEGKARLTVYREDWGFSAMVEPPGPRFTLQ